MERRQEDLEVADRRDPDHRDPDRDEPFREPAGERDAEGEHRGRLTDGDSPLDRDDPLAERDTERDTSTAGEPESWPVGTSTTASPVAEPVTEPATEPDTEPDTGPAVAAPVAVATPAATVGSVDRAAGQPAGTGGDTLIRPEEASDFTRRWEAVQARFLDSPRHAVEGANELVAEVVEVIVSRYSEQRSGLEERWTGDGERSTEDLRVTLQGYRDLLKRLLAS